ncbi:unnamed protein product [Rotaria sordida]|uniref:Uncharacterized protein n=1 Tax=Rotaria sordida TaxID=392033 RepID=A0A815RWJ4_9BILA|nr:unnamed protein product [Rotaria sordida]CAF4037611.1 unnamed protein product [Rotaria sordida]
MVDGEQSSSYVRERQDDYEKLWEDLQIDFRLESFKFPDDKIYGTINIIPESSRKLIKKFVLVIDRSKRIEFDPHYENLSASGFNTNRKKSSAYIEAIPNNTKWAREVKISKDCCFYFTGEVFVLSPTINFKWSDDEENPKPNLIIKWYHIGDKNAQQYILYLDDAKIRYIHQKQVEDSFYTSICGFECGQKHTFQLAARLNNGKETYRSDLREFTVPGKESIDDASTEFITVSNEPPPPDLPGTD